MAPLSPLLSGNHIRDLGTLLIFLKLPYQALFDFRHPSPLNTSPLRVTKKNICKNVFFTLNYILTASTPPMCSTTYMKATATTPSIKTTPFTK